MTFFPYEGDAMGKESGKNLSLFHILNGLSEGLSLFSGQSRAALLFGLRSQFAGL